MRLLYTILLYFLQPLIWLKLLLRSRKAPAYRRRWLERYGFCKGRVQPNGLLLHAVSVGETVAAIPLVNALKKRYPHLPITITTMTPTGSERVIAAFGNSVSHVYLPYDLPCALRRFFRHLNPKAVIIMETELWPNMINQLYKQHIPLIIANARLSERSANGYKKLGSLTQNVMRQISLVAAQTIDDGERFVALGLERTHLSITGSVKYDIAISAELTQSIQAVKLRWSTTRPIWIAASTHNGEESAALEAHKTLLKVFPNLLLILVPRHLERFDFAKRLTEQAHLKPVLLSSGQAPTEETNVVIGDTMGDLMMLYGLADIAFVGGSLIEHGGQNPLEPAAHGIPIITGPHIFNFKEIGHRLTQSGGLTIVHSRESLADCLHTLLSNQEERIAKGQQSLKVLQQNQGALGKLLTLLDPYLDSH